MAFIRTYSQRYQGQIMGDPFVGRLFKKIKKWQPGKSLARIAAPALSLLPIPGAGLAAQFLGGRGGRGAAAPPVLSMFGRIAARYGIPIQTVADIAAQHGILDMGDPGKGTRKRQGAKRNTQKKNTKRDKSKKPGRRPSGSAQQIDWGKLAETAVSSLPVAGQVAVDLFKEMKRTGVTPAGIPVPPQFDPSDLGIVPGMPGTAAARAPKAVRIDPRTGQPVRKKQRVINLTALGHALSRVGKFQKTAARVMRSKQWRRVQGPGYSPRRARGHKAGCRCAVCSR